MVQLPTPTVPEQEANAPEDRRFSDKQAAQILKRAAELQCDHPGSLKKTTSTGFSLKDLEAAAHESGLDPKLVRQAALEIRNQSKPTKASVWTGGPTTIFIERWIDEEINESDYPEIVAELCRSFGDPGTSSVLGNALTWMPTPMYHSQRRNLHVMISPQNGRTSIRVQENFASLAGRIFGGILGGVGGGGLGLVIPLTAFLRIPGMIPLAALLWIGALYQFSRQLFRKQVEKYERSHHELVDRIAYRISTGKPRSLETSSDLK